MNMAYRKCRVGSGPCLTQAISNKDRSSRIYIRCFQSLLNNMSKSRNMRCSQIFPYKKRHYSNRKKEKSTTLYGNLFQVIYIIYMLLVESTSTTVLSKLTMTNIK